MRAPRFMKYARPPGRAEKRKVNMEKYEQEFETWLKRNDTSISWFNSVWLEKRSGPPGMSKKYKADIVELAWLAFCYAKETKETR